MLTFRRCHRAIAIAALAVTPLLSMGFAAQAADPADGDTDQILVKYRAGTSAADKASAESQAGAQLKETIEALETRVLTVASHRAGAAIEALSRNPHVDYAELDGVAQAMAITPNDTYWSKQWGVAKIGTPTAWDTTTGSSSVVVAVLDTGIDATHPDLQGAVVAGYDFVNGDSNPADDQGHGTNVSGIIAARSNNGAGVAGVCWACVIMPVKVLNASGSGSYSAISNGITWAADRGAKVINMSLGGSSASSTLQSAITYAANKGAVIVAAAGNAGTSTQNYPAAYEPTIAVAASDSRDARYSWSSYGTWVEVAAPGCDYTTVRGGTYGEPCGTSFASPMTAGVVALMRSANPGASNSAIRSALLSTADPVSYVANGRVNALDAVAAVAGSSSPAPAPAPTSSTVVFDGRLSKQSTSKSHTVTSAGGAFTADLSFSRAPSLTLTVRNAAGSVVTQVSGASVLKASGSLTAGQYTFTVSGTATPYTLTVKA